MNVEILIYGFIIKIIEETVYLLLNLYGYIVIQGNVVLSLHHCA